MNSRLRIAIAGGSLGGLTTALALYDAGHDVEVFERSQEPLDGRGAGIVLHPATVRSLAQRTIDLASISLATRSVDYLDRKGALLCKESCRFRLTSYFALYQALLRFLPAERYHLGRTAAGLRQEDGAATLVLADGTEHRCDIVVFADGIHSFGRRLLAPQVEPRYAGYIAWRGTVDEADLSRDTFAQLAGQLCYYIAPGTHILTYPIPSPRGNVDPGHRLTNWVWYRNVAEDGLRQLMTDRRGKHHPISMAPGTVLPGYIDDLRRVAAAELPPALAETVRKTTDPFVQAIVDIAVPRMAFGRACLIGDAAFVVRPHVAAGTAKAAEDGWQLAQVLARASGVDEALRRWEANQLALGRDVVRRATAAGDRIQRRGAWRVGDALPFGLYRTGDSELPDHE